MIGLGGLALAPLALGGALLLRRAWTHADARRPWLIVGGWALLAVAVAASVPFLGAARGPSIVLALASTLALAVVAAGVELREAKRKARPQALGELALEPSDRRRVAWRGWLRGFLAGPLGGAAAMAVGLAVAVCFPAEVKTRLIVGGMLVPFLWAGGMAWTLSDDKILRALAVLVGVTVAGFGAVFLKGSL